LPITPLWPAVARPECGGLGSTAYPVLTLYLPCSQVRPRASYGQGDLKAAPAGLENPPGPIPTLAARTVSRLYGRESSFLISHTNEFCGKLKVDREARNTKSTLKVARWAYERGRQRRQAAGQPDGRIRPPDHCTISRRLPLCGPLYRLESPGLVRGGFVVVVGAHEAGRSGGTAYWARWRRSAGNRHPPKAGLCG
jgi:hypothetical protein